MPEFKNVGKPKPLIDGHVKVTGALRYAPDLTIPGMLHARFVNSAYAHAKILSIDPEDALAVPGVVAVLTAKDLPDISPSGRNKLLLARDRVLFAGQPVALVIAESEHAAEDGVEQVFVDYDPLPAAVTIDEAIADDAPLVWPDGVPKGDSDAGAHGAEVDDEDAEEDEDIGNITNHTIEAGGDITAGFAEADIIIEKTFNTSMVHQSSLETHSAIAQPAPSHWRGDCLGQYAIPIRFA